MCNADKASFLKEIKATAHSMKLLSTPVKFVKFPVFDETLMDGVNGYKAAVDKLELGKVSSS